MAPAIPSPAPMITAPSALGNRICQTVVASTLCLPINEKYRTTNMDDSDFKREPEK